MQTDRRRVWSKPPSVYGLDAPVYGLSLESFAGMFARMIVTPWPMPLWQKPVLCSQEVVHSRS